MPSLHTPSTPGSPSSRSSGMLLGPAALALALSPRRQSSPARAPAGSATGIGLYVLAGGSNVVRWAGARGCDGGCSLCQVQCTSVGVSRSLRSVRERASGKRGGREEEGRREDGEKGNSLRAQVVRDLRRDHDRLAERRAHRRRPQEGQVPVHLVCRVNNARRSHRQQLLVDLHSSVLLRGPVASHVPRNPCGTEAMQMHDS